MPSQEFYAILELIIYPDVVEPELLRGKLEHPDGPATGTTRAALPSFNVNPN
jgi:hypothetical protein